MKNPLKSRKAISSIFATLMTFLVIIASGISLFHFVMSKVDFMTNTFNNQMSNLILKTCTMNSTHIIARLLNTGTMITEITSAYIDGTIASLLNTVRIDPDSAAIVFITGTFARGNTYQVKLQNLLNTAITFEATF